MKFLMSLINQKEFKEYYVQRITSIMKWKDIYKSSECYESIMLCIIQSSSFSRDHIIAISGGQIFDSNLTYALTLNATNLDWCASHGKDGIFFQKFLEQVKIGKREKNRSKKRKKNDNEKTDKVVRKK